MRKKILLLLFILNILIYIFASEIEYARIYCFKIISFNKEYEIYCTIKKNGYYKYPIPFHSLTLYITYEGRTFYKQCEFDENLVVFDKLYPANMWSNSRGEVTRFKKRYGPVIEKDRKRKNYPYGFGKN